MGMVGVGGNGEWWVLVGNDGHQQALSSTRAIETLLFSSLVFLPLTGKDGLVPLFLSCLLSHCRTMAAGEAWK